MQPQSRILIDLDIIRANYIYTCTRVGQNTQVAGVVKSNAYGMGINRVVPVLERAGCPLFFVATPYEAADLRSITNKPIAVLNAILDAHNAEFMAASDIMPVLNSMEDVVLWKEFCSQSGTPYPAMLQLDTGMRRVGLSEADVGTIHDDPSLLRGLNIHTIMSHFASADSDESNMTIIQHHRFEDMLQKLPQDIVKNAKKSLSNSAGIMRNPKYHYDLVRPGRSLFGLQPIPDEQNTHIRNPLTLEARIIQTLGVKQGEPVGYNETWKAPRDITVATLSMGYADGVRRILSNRANMLYNGRELPIVGRISMDMSMVRIDHLGDVAPQKGDWVAFLNNKQTPDKIAKMADTNGYEILTGLGKRAQRIYTESESYDLAPEDSIEMSGPQTWQKTA